MSFAVSPAVDADAPNLRRLVAVIGVKEDLDVYYS